MNEKNRPQTLVDEKLALSLFLDSLMREPVAEVSTEVTAEVVTEIKVPTEPAAEATPVKLETRSPLETEVKAKTNIEIPLELPVEAPAESKPETVIDTETTTDTVAEVETVQETEDSGLAENFQAMLFKVAGLTLAVPLDELSGVVEFQGNLTAMPGSADFYMGLLQYLDKTVPVVDTARLVFPEEKRVQLAGDDPAERVTRIVLISNTSWGLACDEVDEVITLNKEDVHWRSSRTQRKWLLGTVKEHMCALIDAHAFAEKLEQGSE